MPVPAWTVQRIANALVYAACTRLWAFWDRTTAVPRTYWQRTKILSTRGYGAVQLPVFAGHGNPRFRS